MATESTTYSGQTYTVTYHYDAQGRLSKLTYPSGREAEYTYDDRQFLKTIKWEGAQIEDRSYNDNGLLTGVTRAFVDETRTYNAGSQLTQINNTNVGSQTYTYDLNGNVTSESLSGVMANYSFSTIHAGGPFADGYDAEDRLMRFKRSGVTEDILLTRSNIGNIANVNRNGSNTARGYNTAHGLTTVTGGTTQTYDTDGNTTKLHTNVNAAWYDAGRMKNTDVPAGASAGIQGFNEYGYVGGTRVWKKITRSGSVVEHRVHVHAGPNLVAEYNAGVAASTPVQEYVYAGEIDSMVLIRRSDATKYGVTRNRQWSITALHDMANGNIVERYAYEMTGKRTIYAANGTTVRSTSSFGNNFGYTNRWHDTESGLMYFRARYYNPLTGEFLSRDPMEFVDGMSLYRGYMGTTKSDPYGEMIVSIQNDHVSLNPCGGFGLTFEHRLEPPPGKRFPYIVLQLVCAYAKDSSLTRCFEGEPTQAGVCPCVEGSADECEEKCFIEYLSTGKDVSNATVATDINSMEKFSAGPCSSRGSFAYYRQVRAFHLTRGIHEALAKFSQIPMQRIDGKCHAVDAGMGPRMAIDSRDAVPAWWETHFDEAEVTVRSDWNCCGGRSSQTLSISNPQNRIPVWVDWSPRPSETPTVSPRNEE